MNSFVEHLYRFECVILLYHYFLFTRFYHVITKKNSGSWDGEFEGCLPSEFSDLNLSFNHAAFSLVLLYTALSIQFHPLLNV